MCNAWNHPPGCRCGWGGEGHKGRRRTGRGAGVTEYDISSFIKIFRRSFVNPNAKCPICGTPVFYYESDNGSKVFFDELGPPWPKHPCTNNAIPERKRLGNFKKREVDGYEWQRTGWHPFFIAKFATYHAGAKLFDGYIAEERIKLYVRASELTRKEWKTISPRCPAFVRRCGGGAWDLSVLMDDGLVTYLTGYLSTFAVRAYYERRNEINVSAKGKKRKKIKPNKRRSRGSLQKPGGVVR